MDMYRGNAVRRGDILYIVRNYAEEGSEQQAGRPAIVVSNDICNASSPVIEVVYLTTQEKMPLPTHCTIMSTGRESTALCEQITAVYKDRINGYVGHVTDEEMSAINRCLVASLDLGDKAACQPAPSASPDVAVLKAERDFFENSYNKLLDRLIGGR